MNKQRIKNQSDLNFSLSLALFDTLPVIFFCLGMLLIASRFHNVFFLLGIILCTLAGCGKVLWKILIASSGYNIYLLNRQLRILMPLGFFFVIVGLITGRNTIHFTKLIQQMIAFPSCIFFGITIIGMICMSIFAFKLDSTKVKSNWIEQITNAIAQGCFLLGVLSLLF